MSANFSPQPPITGPSTGSMRTPLSQTPDNANPPYLATASKQYYSGGVRFAAGTAITERLAFNNLVPLGTTALSTAPSYNGFFYGSPFFQCGVISFWVNWSPSEQTDSGWPRIGQNAQVNISSLFGTDPAHARMGSVQVQLVPLPETAVEFSSGAT